MFWTLELASHLEDAPWPATKDELIDYSIRSGAALVEAIVRDEKKLFTCCVSLEGEYGQNDICLGVPVVIGKNGWEKIVDYKLNEEEQTAFNKSAEAVRSMNSVLSTLSI